MATLQYSFAPHFGTEDVMEMSSDPTRRVDEDEDIDIDFEFTENLQPDEVDEEMTEEFDDAAMPLDTDSTLPTGLEGSDAQMEEGAAVTDEVDIGLIADEEAQDAGADIIQDQGAADEDLFDEITDEIEATVPNQDSAPISHSQPKEPAEDSQTLDNTTDQLNHHVLDSTEITPEAGVKSPLFENPGSEDGLFKRNVKSTEPSSLVDVPATDGNVPLPSQLRPSKEESRKQQSKNINSGDDAHEDEALQPDLRDSTDPIYHVTNHDDISAFVDATREEKRQEALHPVVVVYQEEEILLFPPGQTEQEEAQTFLLDEESLADKGVLTLLTACRAVLGDSIDENDELEISIEALDLKISEVSQTFYAFVAIRSLKTYSRV